MTAYAHTPFAMQDVGMVLYFRNWSGVLYNSHELQLLRRVQPIQDISNRLESTTNLIVDALEDE